jgi:hypothetical protein
MGFAWLLVLAGCGGKPAAPPNPAENTAAASNQAPQEETTSAQAGPDFKQWEQMLTSDDYQTQLNASGEFERLVITHTRTNGTASHPQGPQAVASIKGLLTNHWAKLGGSEETLTLAMIYLDENDLKETRALLKEHPLPHIRMQIVKSLGKRASPNDKTYYLGLFAQDDPKVESAVQALAEVLKTDAEPDVREQAANMLAHIGPEAKSALPQLGEVMADEQANPRVRVAAGAAVGKIMVEPSP